MMWIQVIMAIIQAAPQIMSLIPQIIAIIAQIEKAFPGTVAAALSADPSNGNEVIAKTAAHISSLATK